MRTTLILFTLLTLTSCANYEYKQQPEYSNQEEVRIMYESGTFR